LSPKQGSEPAIRSSRSPTFKPSDYDLLLFHSMIRALLISTIHTSSILRFSVNICFSLYRCHCSLSDCDPPNRSRRLCAYVCPPVVLTVSLSYIVTELLVTHGCPPRFHEWVSPDLPRTSQLTTSRSPTNLNLNPNQEEKESHRRLGLNLLSG
jgi:hypothetical protein